jgi:RNA recognition motif-containing protein
MYLAILSDFQFLTFERLFQVDFVKDMFQKFGKIQKIKIHREKNDDFYCYVEFQDPNSASKAYSLNKGAKMNIKHASKDVEIE